MSGIIWQSKLINHILDADVSSKRNLAIWNLQIEGRIRAMLFCGHFFISSSLLSRIFVVSFLNILYENEESTKDTSKTANFNFESVEKSPSEKDLSQFQIKIRSWAVKYNIISLQDIILVGSSEFETHFEFQIVS